MTPNSLRLRLTAGAALWIALALVIAGLSIGYLFVSNVEETSRSELRDAFTRLIASLEPGPGTPRLSRPMADPRYDTPLSGLYWQVERIDGAGLARSRSLWDVTLTIDKKAFSDGKSHFVGLAGPDGQPLFALVRKISFSADTGPIRYMVAVAEDRSVLDESIARFGHDLIVALVLLGLVLMLAAFLQVRLGLKPLDLVRAGIESVRQGRRDRLPEDYPFELRPLVNEVNTLLDTQEKSMAFARARAADLAHGLKTPLSVLGTVADRLRQQGETETANLVETMTHEMVGKIDYQLRLSRLRLRDHAHVYAASLNRALARTIYVLEKTRDGERLDWRFFAHELVLVDIEQHDLGELVGVILENAAKWANTEVVVAVTRDGEAAVATITDDGPGLTSEQIAQIGVRGKRLDETRKGTGLGLSIAMEIVDINGGNLAFAPAEKGGLKVILTLPLARPHAAKT